MALQNALEVVVKLRPATFFIYYYFLRHTNKIQ